MNPLNNCVFFLDHQELSWPRGNPAPAGGLIAAAIDLLSPVEDVTDIRFGQFEVNCD
jgi:hypothetical protein